ncbi:MAG TPA: hypothetical protein VNG51_00500 [Ktedonobacteraceae bacterium]|nr:hypothetical protein [Ktedonobacteraceae bacterium]
MSLTSHIRNANQSPIGQFLRQRFPQTALITKATNAQLRTSKALLPPIHPWPYDKIGLAIENRPPIRFFQQEPDNTLAMLKPVLYAIGDKHYIVTRRFDENYMYSLELKGTQLHETKGFITTSEVDNIFWSLFLDKLTATDDIQLLDEQEEAALTGDSMKGTVLKRLDEEIEGCTKAGEKIKRRIIKLASVITEDGKEDEEDEIIIALREQRVKLLDKKKNLETQRNMLLVQPDPAVLLQQKLTYRRVLAALRANTSKALTQQVKRELIKIFTRKVYIDLLAPRIFRLIIDWRDESWNVTEMICLREGSQSPLWSKEEDSLLLELYPVASIEELLAALPNRALAAIRHRAHRLHIRRGNIYRFNRRENGHPWDEHYSWNDLKFITDYGLNTTNWIYDHPDLETAFRNINGDDLDNDSIVPDNNFHSLPSQFTDPDYSSCNPA